jgi:hypothetical protein
VRDFLASASLNVQTFATYKASPATSALQYDIAIDGQRSNAAIARALFAGDAEQRLRAFVGDLRIPTALHWLVARTETGTAWPILAMQSRFTLPLRHEEPVLLVEPA